METIEGLPIGTVPPIETIPMAVAPARCTVSGNIYRFFHDPETLKVRLTNIDTGESSLSAVTPVFTGDLVSHYSYVVFVQCDETYRIEPVYQPFTGACAWTGSFSGSTELRMAGVSVTGQDFNYVPDDPNVPEVNVLSSPANPGMNEDVRITIEAVDDNAIVFMAARYTLVYADGSRRRVDWEELTPMPGISSRGDRPRYTDQFSITDDGLLRAEITARVCDRGGNERWGSGTVTWMTCSWCGDHVIPIEVNGDPVDKIDVIFIPDASYAGDMDALVEDIGDVLANGYYQNDLFSDNRGKFNFYYLDDEASVTAYPACGFTPPLGSCEDFQDATTFADSIAVLHTNDFRDWSGSKCGRKVFCSEPTSYRTFVHESGHSLFGLKDEYCCDSHCSQNDPNANIWETENACEDDATAEGWDPDDCTPFCPAGSGNCGSGFFVHPKYHRALQLEVVYDGRTYALEQESPQEVLEAFNWHLHAYDPDLLLTEYGDGILLPKLTALSKRFNIPLLLNRDEAGVYRLTRESSFWQYGKVVHKDGAFELAGRWHVDVENSFTIVETDLEGLFELARITQMPPQRQARASIGTGLSSLQLSWAHRNGYLIPAKKREPEEFKSAATLMLADRGGLIFQPPIGYHDDVAELDFVSMYPSIMVNHNVSPETVNCRCCSNSAVPELGYTLCERREGIVPATLRMVVLTLQRFPILPDWGMLQRVREEEGCSGPHQEFMD